MKRAHTMAIGQQTAEDIKLEIGSAMALEPELSGEVRGRDLVSGLPKNVNLTSSEVLEACAEPLHAIVETVKSTLERTPPELAADIADRGIVMAGGGALLRGLDQLVREETNLPVTIASDPLCCVALGTGKVLDELELLRKVAIGG
jgi:rod shape-determining protein MreB